MAKRVVLITGCSSGIGEATARAYAQAGHTVVATARRIETLDGLKAIGCEVDTLDVTDEASRVGAVERTLARHGRIDVLINNAGYSETGAVEEVPLAALRRQYETNVFGLVRMVQLVVPSMRAHGSGRIVNVSSVGGKITLPLLGVYNSSKWALESLSDALRMELADFGIDVVLIEPGGVKTRFNATAEATLEANVSVGPYSPWHATARDVFTDPSYDAAAATPEQAAAVLLRAGTARRPRTRYVITTFARVLLFFKRWLPDRWFDRLLRTMLPGGPTAVGATTAPLVAEAA